MSRCQLRGGTERNEKYKDNLCFGRVWNLSVGISASVDVCYNYVLCVLRTQQHGDHTGGWFTHTHTGVIQGGVLSTATVNVKVVAGNICTVLILLKSDFVLSSTKQQKSIIRDFRAGL